MRRCQGTVPLAAVPLAAMLFSPILRNACTNSGISRPSRAAFPWLSGDSPLAGLVDKNKR